MIETTTPPSPDQFEQIISEVMDGETYEVTRHGEPVAVIIDIERYEQMFSVLGGELGGDYEPQCVPPMWSVISWKHC